MSLTQELIALIENSEDIKHFKELNWKGSFEDYLGLFRKNPGVARSSYQRLYDMILSYGTSEYKEYKKPIIKYKFFEDPFDEGKDAVFGIDLHLMKLVNVLKAASLRYGPEKRVILLHGPVGSSKSTIVRLIKKGFEHYCKTMEGALYSYRWKKLTRDNDNLNRIFGLTDDIKCPIHGEPLLLVPKPARDKLLSDANKSLSEKDRIVIEGDLCPTCRLIYNELFSHYEGDWLSVMKHIEVFRLVLSEKDRVGIGTFQPRDEKNQDSTELTGDINYRKIAEYGSESDPRAFNFDGEFNIANRGLIEFVEMLKLDVAFLYDLLGASQEHKIKPKKFAQTDIDEVIIGHTNEPEYRKLQNNEYMEALRDRTIKIDIPYISRVSAECKIYEKDFTNKKIKGKHIAPHTIEIAAMWAVLTRMEEPKKANLTLLQKLKLYDGKSLPGFTEDNVKELRKEALREGMEGISPRYVQDKISNVLVSSSSTSINPFMLRK
jgi:serine protein kinase